MAVNTQPPLPKSTPDVGRINSYNGLVVTVTKFLQARNTVGSAIVTTQRMTKDQLFALPVQLPLQHGPGFYKFDVTDEGGTGSDEWLVRLGPEVPTQENPFMASSNGVLPPGPSLGGGPPVGEGVVHLGHGFYYNEALGTLTTPWRGVYNWKQGDPMPQQPTSASAAPHLSLVSPNAQPGSWPQSNWSGWGSYPATDDSRVKELEKQIERQNQQAIEDRRSREAAELRTEMQRQAAEQNQRFEKLIEKLFTKPVGPSDELLEMRRRNEALEQQAREDRRAAEQRERDASLRAEMKAQQDRFETMIRELNANKQDPMLPMLMQMIQASQQSAQEAVKAIQASTTAASTSSERNVQQMLAQLSATMMNPMQLMQMVESARNSGSDGSKMLVESMRDSLNMQRDVFGQLLDVASQGQQPAWVAIAEKALGQVGAVGEALAKRQQQQQPVQQVRQQPPPQQQRVQQAQRPQQIATNGSAGRLQVAAPTAPVAKAEPVQAGPTPADIPPGEKGYTMAQLRDASVEDIRASVAPLSDDDFFGPLVLPYAKQIREQVATGMKPEGAAELLMRNREELAKLSTIPPAVELLYAEHIEVLIERLLPTPVTDKYRAAVVRAIEKTLDEESSDDENEEEQPDA